jgi:hypothetical protein
MTFIYCYDALIAMRYHNGQHTRTYLFRFILLPENVVCSRSEIRIYTEHQRTLWRPVSIHERKNCCSIFHPMTVLACNVHCSWQTFEQDC